LQITLTHKIDYRPLLALLFGTVVWAVNPSRSLASLYESNLRVAANASIVRIFHDEVDKCFESDRFALYFCLTRYLSVCNSCSVTFFCQKFPRQSCEDGIGSARFNVSAWFENNELRADLKWLQAICPKPDSAGADLSASFVSEKRIRNGMISEMIIYVCLNATEGVNKMPRHSVSPRAPHRIGSFFFRILKGRPQAIDVGERISLLKGEDLLIKNTDLAESIDVVSGVLYTAATFSGSDKIVGLIVVRSKRAVPSHDRLRVSDGCYTDKR
jgi:hypothetical protein